LEIYLDVLLVTNFLANYLALRAVGAITKAGSARLRPVLAASAGAIYAAVVCLFPTPLLSAMTVKLLVGLGLVYLAFGGGKALFLRFVVFLGVSAAMAGAVFALSLSGSGEVLPGGVLYLDISLPLLLIVSTVAYLLLTLAFRTFGKASLTKLKKHVTAEVYHQGITANFDVLVDTGCLLTDPVSGRAVLVTSLSAVEPLLPPPVRSALQNGESVESVLSLAADCNLPMRLVFCTSALGQREMLAAFRPERLILDGKNKTGTLLAVTPKGLSGDDGIRAVIGAAG
jgi:stage II sporulation protein GA (sporulation sigma-E factor processing peptidase)